MYLFAYGSLTWNPNFEYESKKPAYIKNFTIRFWNKHHKYGRVATIIRAPTITNGILYKIDDNNITNLDLRENNYSRFNVSVFDETTAAVTLATVYIANNVVIEDIDTTAKAIANSNDTSYLTNLYKTNPNVYLEELVRLVKYHKKQNRIYRVLILILIFITVFTSVYNFQNFKLKI